MIMTTPLDNLLDDLAAYLGTPDTACVGLPPRRDDSRICTRSSASGSSGIPGCVSAATSIV
jgi:hypothetical protein